MGTQLTLHIPRQHRRKLFLPPGQINLILLPIMLIGYSQQHHFFQQPRAMEVVWLDPTYYNKLPGVYPINFHDRQYQHIHLTGREAEDKTKLDFAQLKIRELIANQDSVRGIHIHFRKGAKYWALVRTLDICHIEGTYRYFFHQDGLWISVRPPIPNDLPNLSNCILFSEPPTWIKSQAQLEAESRARITFWVKTAKEYWASGLLFACLVGLAGYRLRKERASSGSQVLPNL